MSSDKRQQLILWAVCGLTLVAVALRLAGIQKQMSGDEAWTFISFASRPLTEGLSTYWTTNNHLLNTLLMHLAYVTFGNEPIWLRLPAFFAGVLMVPATYAAGRAFFNARVGLLAAALVTPATALISYSVNGRGYTMLALCFLLLLVVARRLRSGGRLAGWAAFSLIAALGFYALPIMIYPFAIVVAWLGLSYLIEQRGAKRRRLLAALVAGCLVTAIVTLILYAPVIDYVAHLTPEIATDFQNIVPRPLDNFLKSLRSDTKTVFSDWMNGFSPVITIVLAAGVAAGIVFQSRRADYRVPLWLAAVVSLIMLLLIQRPVFLSRIWLFLLPLYFILAAAGIEWLGSRIIRPHLLTTVVIIGTVALTIGLAGPQLLAYASRSTAGNIATNPEKMLDFLQVEARSGDLVLLRQRTLNPLIYYAMKRGETLDPKQYLIYFGPFSAHNYATPGPKRVLFVTTELDEPEIVEEIITDSTELRGLQHSAPQLLKRFGSNQVYLLEFPG